MTARPAGCGSESVVDRRALDERGAGSASWRVHWVLGPCGQSLDCLTGTNQCEGFDEADTRLGKRSEGKDSHDRYANIEVDYLLQRMEAFGGLSILATYMKSAHDPAFVRRLCFIVTFPYPGPVERRRMLGRGFPTDTSLGRIDHERLARLHLTGGNIQSMVLTAAFMAAQAEETLAEQKKVTMPLLLEVGRMEFGKLERPVNVANFHWVETAGVCG